MEIPDREEFRKRRRTEMVRICKPFDIGAAFDAGWNARGEIHEDFITRVLAKADDLETRLAAVEGEIREGAQ